MRFKVLIALAAFAVMAGTVVGFSGSQSVAYADPQDFCGVDGLEIPDSGDVFDFSEACAEHDVCYGHGGDEYDRYLCDREFFSDMLDSCSDMWDRFDRELWQCRSIARTYYIGVRLGGFLFFPYGPPTCSTSTAVGTASCGTEGHP